MNVSYFCPQLCVGLLFLRSVPPAYSPASSASSASSSLSHTSLSHTIFHTHLCHTPSFTVTHLFVTHHLSWQAWHLATSTCVLHGRRGAWRHRPSFCVAGVALGEFGNIDLRFAWQACTYDTWLDLVACLGPLGRPGRRGTFAWQGWRLAPWTCVLRGRRGASGTVLALVACHTSHCHTQLCHTPPLSNLCHTKLCHTLSFTHNFVTHHLHHTPS